LITRLRGFLQNQIEIRIPFAQVLHPGAACDPSRSARLWIVVARWTCNNKIMAIPNGVLVPDGAVGRPIFGRSRLFYLLALVVLLAVCMVLSWITRDAMANLPFLAGSGAARNLTRGQKALVDQSPWQTAEALAPLAVSAEEHEFARDAERLADHEVDQAFASALRMTGLQAQRRNLTGDALALSQKVAKLQQLLKDDQAQMDNLTHGASSPAGAKTGSQPATGGDDLEVAKAQLGLDSDELADAQHDLERASGDESAQIQAELAAHEATTRKLESAAQADAQVAVLSAGQNRTLAKRVKAWFNQRDRHGLIQQALGQTQADVQNLTAEHNALEAKASASPAAVGAGADSSADRLAQIKDRSTERQILSIYDDRIQTEQQLAAVYGRWSAQVRLQHRIVLHLVLQSFALIVFILICMLLGTALVRRLVAHPSLDRRQRETLRTILQLGIQGLGALFILLVVLGSPQETPTILGLATAALTIALQDFILAFFGWFVLMGKNGIHVGDWVEINGVGGEVIEIGLINTTLLETGDLSDKGHPTGRRISFINSFAIRGQYFNFSTTGQWMWDEIDVKMPAIGDVHAMVGRIQQAVLEETKDNASLAEEEWKRGIRDDGLNRYSAEAALNLRPSGSDIDIQVRYVTRAADRFEVRNRLYRHVIDLFHDERTPEAQMGQEQGPGNETAQPARV
jgi:small-conductance mechanosensitive channel